MKAILPLVAGTLLAAGLMSQAQAAQPKSATAPQASAQVSAAAQSLVDPNSVGKWALQALALVDRGELAQLWDDASAAMKRELKREAFVAGVQTARKGLGSAVGREWLQVSRQQGDGKGVPAGEYASAEFLVRYAQGAPRVEMVTFRRDQDGVWRFMGYVVR